MVKRKEYYKGYFWKRNKIFNVAEFESVPLCNHYGHLAMLAYLIDYKTYLTDYKIRKNISIKS